METFEELHAEYQKLDSGIKTLVRRVATMELQEYGYEEIGSSDVSCQVYSLRKSLGSYEAIVTHGLNMIRNS